MKQTVFLEQRPWSWRSIDREVKPLKFVLASPDWERNFTHFFCRACLLNGCADLQIELKDLEAVVNHIKEHKKQKHIVERAMLHDLMKALEDDFVWKD